MEFAKLKDPLRDLRRSEEADIWRLVASGILGKLEKLKDDSMRDRGEYSVLMCIKAGSMCD
jgi:hypothetical protein